VNTFVDGRTLLRQGQYFCDGVVPYDYALLPPAAQYPMQWLVGNAHPTSKVLGPAAVHGVVEPPPAAVLQ
jgi:hypothetical protein